MKRWKYLFICVCGYPTGGTVRFCPKCKHDLDTTENEHDNGFGGEG